MQDSYINGTDVLCEQDTIQYASFDDGAQQQQQQQQKKKKRPPQKKAQEAPRREHMRVQQRREQQQKNQQNENSILKGVEQGFQNGFHRVEGVADGFAGGTKTISNGVVDGTKTITNGMLDGFKQMFKPIDDMIKPIFPDTDLFWILVFLVIAYYVYQNHMKGSSGLNTKAMPDGNFSATSATDI